MVKVDLKKVAEANKPSIYQTNKYAHWKGMYSDQPALGYIKSFPLQKKQMSEQKYCLPRYSKVTKQYMLNSNIQHLTAAIAIVQIPSTREESTNNGRVEFKTSHDVIFSNEKNNGVGNHVEPLCSSQTTDILHYFSKPGAVAYSKTEPFSNQNQESGTTKVLHKPNIVIQKTEQTERAHGANDYWLELLSHIGTFKAALLWKVKKDKTQLLLGISADRAVSRVLCRISSSLHIILDMKPH
ncbi:hypothetical protein BDEG_28006 [Batrachochytrium dendrobatidis JEL423]|uniref:Uncharacterized protein n=1 Tax=Batrachochytrium dendrobatidis (strain JEL423) TaxID=403673 RepID=A0A177WYS5_BATDL|nr:hypothetical protein BDEG_28006 [Batrachochytrium dendrobatidis JEL423]